MEFEQCDEQYYYTNISFYENIISLFIIYIIAIIIIVFFIKIPVEVMKESLEENLFVEEKENLLSKIEEEILANEEELLVNEEELFDNEEKLLDTEEEQLLDTEEELIATEEELIATEEELLANEEELLLANYNKKQRGIALQEAYKEKLDVLLKKKNEINTKLDNFNRCGYNLFFNTDSSGLSESVVNKILLLRMIHINISKSISNEMPSNEEILRTAKKAGIFDSPYDILELLKIKTNAFDNAHPFYNEYKEVLSKI
jgi:DNA gyrase/topoisomerase IV subunit A